MHDWETDPRTYAEVLHDWGLRINGGKSQGMKQRIAMELRYVSLETLEGHLIGRRCPHERTYRRLMTLIDRFYDKTTLERIPGQHISDDEIATARQMISKGASVGEAARVLGISEAGLYRRIPADQRGGSRHGSPTLLAKDLQTAEKMILEGASIQTVARALGVSHTAIRSRIKNGSLPKTGYVRNGPRLTPQRVSKIMAMIEAGHPDREIAEACNVAVSTVYKRRLLLKAASSAEG